MKRLIVVVVILVLAALAAWWWYRQGGVTHGELKALVAREGEVTRERVASESRQINARLERIEGKLDRVEAKLDRLIEMATPRLPDGMEISR